MQTYQEGSHTDEGREWNGASINLGIPMVASNYQKL
jgi:hypothetical protein